MKMRRRLHSVYKVTMSARGQLVIPAEIRRRLGLKGGVHFRLYDSQGKLTLVPEVEDPVQSGLGFLRRELGDEKPAAERGAESV